MNQNQNKVHMVKMQPESLVPFSRGNHCQSLSTRFQTLLRKHTFTDPCITMQAACSTDCPAPVLAFTLYFMNFFYASI